MFVREIIHQGVCAIW